MLDVCELRGNVDKEIIDLPNETSMIGILFCDRSVSFSTGGDLSIFRSGSHNKNDLIKVTTRV